MTKPFLRYSRLKADLLVALAILLLAGCASQELQLRQEPPLVGARSEEKAVADNVPLAFGADNDKEMPRQEVRFTPTPAAVALSAAPVPAAEPVERPAPVLLGPKVEINFDSLPLPAFINEVFGNILHMSFDINPNLRKLQDLVTLRAATPQEPAELYALACKVLANYGVNVEWQGQMLRFVSAKGAVGEPPLLFSGRALPAVPGSHRPVFQLVPLLVVRNTSVAGWLRTAFKGQNLEIFEDTDRNALLLLGPAPIVSQAMVTIAVLDQPNMRGRFSLRIEPMFLDAEELARLLVDVLNNEGYAAALKTSTGSIIVMPVKAVGAVLVFAADQVVLDHIREWASNLDKPGAEGGKKSFFYYQVRNTGAEDLVATLNIMLSKADLPRPAKNPGKEATPTVATAAPVASGKNLVVDLVRNGLIFNGDADEWQGLLRVIREMDIPPRQVLVEVTVAEISLTDQQDLGVEWLAVGAGIGDLGGVVKTIGGLGIGNGGMTYTLDSAGQTRALLNALATKSRVSILSTPRIMVKSGMSATIDVGTEVPIVTSQSTAPDLGTSSILQQIQYRKTGVLLTVKPVVHSENMVDLEVTQEVSEASPNKTSNVSSPSVFTRKISTSLSLKDGGSVLLGGLISTSASKGGSGVPYLSEIPWIGQLFRVDSENKTRTELIVLIVPYVLNSDREAAKVTEAFSNRLDWFKTDAVQ